MREYGSESEYELRKRIALLEKSIREIISRVPKDMAENLKSSGENVVEFIFVLERTLRECLMQKEGLHQKCVMQEHELFKLREHELHKLLECLLELKQRNVENDKEKAMLGEAYCELKEENSFLKTEYIDWKNSFASSENGDIHNQINLLNERIHCLQDDNQKLKKKIEVIKEHEQVLSDSVENMEKKFCKPIEYLFLLNKLSEKVQTDISSIINITNEITFIVSCSNESIIIDLWRYMESISEDKVYHNDLCILKLIFDYFFDIYIKSNPDPLYIRTVDSTGDYFDEEKHYSGENNENSGIITEIILQGLKNAKTDEIVCKSVVKAI